MLTFNAFYYYIIYLAHPYFKGLFFINIRSQGFLGGSTVENPPAMKKMKTPWVQSLGWEDPPEKGMDIHSNILAWSSPWTEEPGGLQSLGSQRDGHDQPLPHSHAAQLCTETFFLPYSFPFPFIPEY